MWEIVMRNVIEEISKEKYDYYMSKPTAEWKKEIRDKIPISWECGYGYYGTDLVKKDDKYFIYHTLGSSCD